MVENGIIEVLLIEDEEFDVRRVTDTLRPFADQIHLRHVVSNGHAALELLRAGGCDVVIMDFQIAGGLMGEQLIREIRRRANVSTRTTVVLQTFFERRATPAAAE